MDKVKDGYNELFSFLDNIEIKIHYNKDRQIIRMNGFHNTKF